MSDTNDKISRPLGQASDVSARRGAYSMPKLRTYGSVGRLTQSGTGQTDEPKQGSGGKFMQRV